MPLFGKRTAVRADVDKIVAHHGTRWRELAKGLGKDVPDLPVAVAVCDDVARPGYTSIDATELRDAPDVEAVKIEMLARMVVAADRCVAYTGAGISTASGIGDYATRAKDSHAGPHSDALKSMSPLTAIPTIAHHALVKMYRAGMLAGGWIQQNHDGLPQKAGLPQEAINEIHGAWFDPSNPVVKMSGQLRSDLYSNLLKIEAEADLCLTLGTSLSGMNADRIAQSVAKRNRDGKGHGLVVVNLQRTQLDSQCALRLWGILDDVMARVAERAIELQFGEARSPEVQFPLLMGEHAATSCADAAETEKTRNLENVVPIPYGVDGLRLAADSPPRMLNVEEDTEIVLTCGPYAGSRGVVRGRDRGNNIDLTVTVAVNKRGFKAPVPMKLGHWWLDAGVRGAVERFPVANPDLEVDGANAENAGE